MPDFYYGKLNYNPLTFSRATNAHKFDGSDTPVGVPRFETDQYGRGIFLEDNTVNPIVNPTLDSYLIDSNIGWDNTLNGTLKPNGGFSSGYNSGVSSPNIGYHAHIVPDEGIGGSPCFKFMDLNSQFGFLNRWLGVSVTISNPGSLYFAVGDKLTFSFWLKTSDIGKPINVGIRKTLISSGIDTFSPEGQTNLYCSKPDVWERKSITVTVTSDWDLTKKIYAYFYGHYGNEGVLWVDNVQAEKGSYPTSFIDGTRNLEILSCPSSLISTNPWTIEGWFNIPDLPNKFRGLFASWSCFYLGVSSANKFCLSYMTGSQQVVYGTIPGANLPGLHHIAMTFDGSTVKCYWDGKLDINVATNLPTALASTIRIGSLNSSGSYNLQGILYDFKISNKARTPEEILNSYLRGVSVGMEIDPNTILKARFEDSLLYISPIVNTSDEVCLYLEKDNVDLMPSVRDLSMELDEIEGAIYYKSNFGSREFELECKLVADNEAQQKQCISKLATIFDYKNEKALILDRETDKFIRCRLNGNISQKETYLYNEITIPLLATNPFLCSTVRHTFDYSGALITEIENKGTMESPPLITIKGPVTNPSIKIDGKEMKYTGSLTSSDVLTIDVENQVCKFNTSVAKFYNQEFLYLDPGLNSIEISGGTVHIEWHDCWI